MYLRCKMQPRALENLDKCTKCLYPGKRVTKGYVLSAVLEGYENYMDNEQVVSAAVKESDLKQDGSGIAVNFNITVDANEKLSQLKLELDQETGRSLFPAQIIDILFICVVNTIENKKQDKNTEKDKIVYDSDIDRLFVEVSYMLLQNKPEDEPYIEQLKQIIKERAEGR